MSGFDFRSNSDAAVDGAARVEARYSKARKWGIAFLAVMAVLFVVSLVSSLLDTSKTALAPSPPTAPSAPTPNVEETIRIVAVSKVQQLMATTKWPGATVSADGARHTHLVIMDTSMTADDVSLLGSLLEARLGTLLRKRNWASSPK